MPMQLHRTMVIFAQAAIRPLAAIPTRLHPSRSRHHIRKSPRCNHRSQLGFTNNPIPRYFTSPILLSRRSPAGLINSQIPQQVTLSPLLVLRRNRRNSEGHAHRFPPAPGVSGATPPYWSAGDFNRLPSAPNLPAANGNEPVLRGGAISGFQPLPGDQGPPGSPVSEAPVENPRTFSSWFDTECKNIKSDYIHYYSWSTAGELALATAVAAPLANIDLDNDVRGWYQQHVRSSTTDRVASFWKPLGNGAYTIPAFVAMDAVGTYFQDSPLMGTMGEFGDRTMAPMRWGHRRCS